MRLPSLAPLVTGALLLAAPAAHAVLDLDHDGLSDVWQAAYPGAGASADDPDHDGFSNLIENNAGTNPFSATSGPFTSLTPAGNGDFVFRWSTVTNKRYQPSAATDLKNWASLQPAVFGTGGELSVPVAATAPARFCHLNIFDVDSDADLLTAWEEAHLGTSSSKADTDGDGLDDFWEIDRGTNPTLANASADPDADGFSNLREYAAGTDPHVRALPVPGGPVVFWASQPVAPNESILATCAGTDLDSTAELARLPDTGPGSPLDTSAPAPTSWTAVTPHTATPRSVTVTVPGTWTPGLYALRLKNAGTTGPVHLVNRPDPWFVQGDRGDTATPGGTLTVAGNCLELVGPGPEPEGPRAALVRNGAVAAELVKPARLTTSTGYALRYTLPADLAEGDYQLFVHNGCGGPAGWVKFSTFVRTPVETVTIKQATAWPTNSFTVAAPTGTNDDAKFAAALNAAATAGGGIIHVPAGTYVLTQPLLLPRFTVLKGAGRDLTLVRWDNNPRTANPTLAGLVMNRNYAQDEPFGLEDIAFEITNTAYWSAVVYRGFTRTPTTFRRLRLTAPHLDTTLEDNMPFGLYLRRTANLRIEDVEVIASKGIFGRDDVRHISITGSRVRYNNFALKFSGMNHNLIVAGNAIEVIGPTKTNTSLCLDPFFSYTDPYCRDVLWINNTYPVVPGFESQSGGYTADGAECIYRGPAAATNGTAMTLAGPTVTTEWNGKPLTYNWTGGVALILDGRGAGQWRHVLGVAQGTTAVTLDRPWLVAPDATSIVSIITMLGRYLMVDNNYLTENSHDDYYLAVDSIKAGNRWGRAGHPFVATTWTGRHYNGTMPGWHIQFLGNRFAGDGIAGLKTMVNNTPESDYDGVVLAAQVYRNNRRTPAGAGTAALQFRTMEGRAADVLYEANAVDEITFRAKGDEPITVGGLLLRGNTTPDGTTPLAAKPAGSLPGVTQKQ